eukprot:g279.t1
MREVRHLLLRQLVGSGGDGQGGDSGEGALIRVALIVLLCVALVLCFGCVCWFNVKHGHEDQGKKIIERIKAKRRNPRSGRVIRVRPTEEIKAQYNPAAGQWGFKKQRVGPKKPTSLQQAEIGGVQLVGNDRARQRARARARDNMYARSARGPAGITNHVVQGIYGSSAVVDERATRVRPAHEHPADPGASLYGRGSRGASGAFGADADPRLGINSRMVRKLYGDMSQTGDTPIAYRV